MLRAILLALALAATPLQAEVPQVAAAADLRSALPALALAFQASTGETVTLRFAASGTLAQQLANGAPDTVFLSADETLVTRLLVAGLTQGKGQVYARGRLALVSAKTAPLADLPALRRALAGGQVQHLAIANPLIAPYGARAEQALTAARILPVFQAQLVRGENVAQALQYVASGNAEAGVVSAALVHDGRAGVAVALLPARLHSPLRQTLVLMRGAGPVAQRFAAFVLSPAGQKLLAQHGFERP